MICYRDMTFCCNENCTCPEWRKLTPDVMNAARAAGLPVCWGPVCKAAPAAAGQERGE